MHICSMSTTKESGDEGERIALEYLRGKGFTILETNFTWGRNEVDLIARKDHLVIFVEVKLRRSTYAGAPWTAVNVAKQRAIIRAANGYLRFKADFDAEARFDIVSIVLSDGRAKVEHIEDAFYAMR